MFQMLWFLFWAKIVLIFMLFCIYYLDDSNMNLFLKGMLHLPHVEKHYHLSLLVWMRCWKIQDPQFFGIGVWRYRDYLSVFRRQRLGSGICIGCCFLLIGLDILNLEILLVMKYGISFVLFCFWIDYWIFGMITYLWGYSIPLCNVGYFFIRGICG